MLSDFDRNNVAAILTQPDRFHSFEHHLLRLCIKADAANRALLAEVFPEHVELVEAFRDRKLAGMTART